MLTLNEDSLDVDARIIVQSARYQMLKRQKNLLVAVDDEDAKDEDADAVATYPAATTPP